MDIKTEVKAALAILSSIYVCGDAVDYMAAARAKLKRIYAELENGEARTDG